MHFDLFFPAVTCNLYIQHLRSEKSSPACTSRVFSISSGGGKYRVLVKLPTVLSQYLPLVFFNFAVLLAQICVISQLFKTKATFWRSKEGADWYLDDMHGEKIHWLNKATQDQLQLRMLQKDGRAPVNLGIVSTFFFSGLFNLQSCYRRRTGISLINKCTNKKNSGNNISNESIHHHCDKCNVHCLLHASYCSTYHQLLTVILFDPPCKQGDCSQMRWKSMW